MEQTNKPTRRRLLRISSYCFASLLLTLNVIAAIHAYKFTHFKNGGIRTERINLTTAKTFQLLFTGVDNPRPLNTVLPTHPYRTVTINSNVRIECWDIPSPIQPSKGTVV